MFVNRPMGTCSQHPEEGFFFLFSFVFFFWGLHREAFEKEGNVLRFKAQLAGEEPFFLSHICTYLGIRPTPFHDPWLPAVSPGNCRHVRSYWGSFWAAQCSVSWMNIWWSFKGNKGAHSTSQWKMSLLVVGDKRDPVSCELSGCEYIFFAWSCRWRSSLLPNEQGGSLLRSPAPRSHPKILFWGRRGTQVSGHSQYSYL